MVFLIFELFDFLFGALFVATSGNPEDNSPNPVLQRVALALDGPLRSGTLFAPRIDGHVEGRELELRWVGHGVVEVRCRTRSSVELDLRRPIWLRRIFGSAEAVLREGEEPLASSASNLFRRYGGHFLRIRNGRLVFRAAPGPDAQRMISMATDTVNMVWEQARPTVVVQRPSKDESFTSGGRCPFCHEDLREGAPLVVCDSCEAPHHPSCFEEGEGCSIAGCREQRARGRKSSA